MLNTRTLACVAAMLLPGAIADSTVTIMIPALAATTATSTLAGCSGTTTVVIATPMDTGCGCSAPAAAAPPAASSPAGYAAPPVNSPPAATSPAANNGGGYGGIASAVNSPQPNNGGYGSSPQPTVAAAPPANNGGYGNAPAPASSPSPQANNPGYGNPVISSSTPTTANGGAWATGMPTVVTNGNGGYAPAMQATTVKTSSAKATTAKASSANTTSSSAASATASVITKGACKLAPSCAPQGFEVDYYFNPIGGYTKRDSGLDSNYYIVQFLAPMGSAVTNQTFFAQDNTFTNAQGPTVRPNASVNFDYHPGYTRTVNGGLIVDANNFTLVYSGLYQAPATGTFQLCSSADNGNDLYFGDGNAFDCATGLPGPSANKLSRASGGNFINPVACINVAMTKGSFYPVRNVMGNWGGFSAFNFTITPPGGKPTNMFDGMAYQPSCTGGKA